MIICKNFSFNYSRVNAEQSLYDYLEKENLIVISDVDTRALVSYIRDNGAMNAIICTDGTPVEKLVKEFDTIPDMKGLELASKVSTKEPYCYGNENSKYKILNSINFFLFVYLNQKTFKTAVLIGPKFFCGTSQDHREGLRMINISKICV